MYRILVRGQSGDYSIYEVVWTDSFDRAKDMLRYAHKYHLFFKFQYVGDDFSEELLEDLD